MTEKVVPHGKEKAKNVTSYRTNLLSSREIEVLTLIASGKEYADIACELSMSKTTVKAHVERVGKKLNAINRTHSVAIAVVQGLIKF